MTRPIGLTVLAALLGAPSAHVLAATLELGTTGQLRVQANGTIEADAKIYRSVSPPPAFLVFTKAFPRPVEPR